MQSKSLLSARVSAQASDYEYGQAREALAQAALYATAVEKSCYSPGADSTNPRCSSLDSSDFGWKVLGIIFSGISVVHTDCALCH